MKTALRISFLLNAALVACLWFLWNNPRHGQKVFPLRAEAKTIIPAQKVQPMAPAAFPPAQTPEAAFFRWNQLESTTDYRIYIRNLRKVGCPEQTLRDIVAGNVDRAFVAQRRQLNLDPDGNDAGPWSTPAEIRLVDELLGEDDGSSLNGTLAQGQDSAPFPLVLHTVNLDALGLSDDQKQVIAQLQQQFIDSIGGPYQDPHDPAYRQRWQKAQPESDTMLKTLLGVSIYENYQLAAASPPTHKAGDLK
jgi:hypothetical protein